MRIQHYTVHTDNIAATAANESTRNLSPQFKVNNSYKSSQVMLFRAHKLHDHHISK